MLGISQMIARRAVQFLLFRSTQGRGFFMSKVLKGMVMVAVLVLLLALCCAQAEVPKVESSMTLDYARHFTLDYCEGGYQLVTTIDDKGETMRFLTVPEGKEAPADLDADITVLQMPLDNLLISSTPTTSLINAIGALDAVTLTTTDYDTWYIENVKAAMDAGKMTYIGSYKEPDFEALVAAQPPFSVFSTMLLSVPDVAEKLTEIGIPYMLDESTYENHPLGRVEWIKLYGALLNKTEEAEAAFAAQKNLVESLAEETEKKTVSMFYITSKGALYARNGGDYMAKMLELAGGEYILADMNPDKAGTQQMEMEKFYAEAGEADLIIYIWSLGGKPQTLEDMIARNDMLAEFKAVKEGNVWCTTPDYFQISDTIGNMIVDMNKAMHADSSDTAFTYLFRLQ